uniref:PL29 family lyase N-terminal domain-containing protein n=1 Tax=uncultured Bacteroides sp. TaxID=162156 RepID=UPI0025EA564E|nr:PL29 family lyase N-terminal domain-containing protein [uncultured Bacteroides sp.]
MKRKFVKVMFLGALTLSTVTYVGCKDYDDDIDNLQTQIDANKASIAKLQEFVDAGKWVTSVDPIGEDGFKITFNDGKSYTIKSGKDGEQGKAATITTDPVTKNWIINGTDIGICAEGKNGDVGKGEPGPAGYAPQISENGFWIVWNAETGKPEETDIKAAADMYISEDPANPLVWVLNVLNKETKKWEKVSLPKSARITSLTVLGVKSDGSVDVASAEASATLYYGVAGSDIKFNGIDKFKKKDDMLIARGGSMIHAMINPVNLSAADIQAYKIGLTDSKGNTSFVVSNIADNVSEKALTRADAPKATANKGVYDLTLDFASGVTDKELTALDASTVYALTTKDAWNNDIISQYGVKVEVKKEAQQLKAAYTSEKPINETYKLDELIGDDLGKVVAYYYTVADADLKAVDATFDKVNNTIKANKAGTLDVKFNYLATDGKTYEADNAATLTITFTYVTEKAEINDMTWVVNAKTLTATSDIVGPSVDVIRDNVDLTAAAGPIDTKLVYTDGKVTINGKKDLEYENGITLALKGLNAKGKEVADLTSKDITKYVIKATFDKATVAAVPHNATVKFRNAKATPALKNEFLYETTFKIIVQQNNDLFSFKRASSYFDGDKATAYGKVYDKDTDPKVISYDLYSLYQVGSILEGENTTNDFVTFSEVRPTKKVDGKEVIADKWLSDVAHSGVINVKPFDAFGGVYTERDITVTYAPFGNPRLNAIVDKIQLTVKSEIFEGEFAYAKLDKNKKVIGTKDNPFEVDGGTSVTILESEFTKKLVYGTSYDFSDERITKVEIELADDNAKTYLQPTEFKVANKVNAATISKNASATGIQTPPVCELKVKITDKWGKVTSAPIYVKVTK